MFFLALELKPFETELFTSAYTNFWAFSRTIAFVNFLYQKSARGGQESRGVTPLVKLLGGAPPMDGGQRSCPPGGGVPLWWEGSPPPRRGSCGGSLLRGGRICWPPRETVSVGCLGGWAV